MRDFQRSKSSQNPSGFVNALAWNELRASLRKKPSQRTGNRVPVLAAESANTEYGCDLILPTVGESERTIVVNEENCFDLDNRFSTTEWESMLHEVSVHSVDDCFSRLDEWMILETHSDSQPESDYDLELGLLESVQSVALDLTRELDSVPSTPVVEQCEVTK